MNTETEHKSLIRKDQSMSSATFATAPHSNDLITRDQCIEQDELEVSLKSATKSDGEFFQPKGLPTTLLPHQRNALPWPVWRESEAPFGEFFLQ